MEFEKRLKELNIQHSFSKKGYHYDNACIESFHSILKKEEVYQNTYLNFEQATQALFEYIEGFYNQARIHGSIDYLSPNEMQRKALIA